MKKILMVGDSHAGITFPLLSDLLQQDGYEVQFLYNNGWATYSYTRKPSELLSFLENDPDIIIVSLGGNNHQLDTNKYSAHVQEFLELVGYPKRKVLWISPKHADREDVQARHVWTHEYLSKNLPNDIDYYNVLKSRYPMASDQVHYPRSSYELFVEELYPQIIKSLTPKSVLPLVLSTMAVVGYLYLS